ncbi:hypothetical protein KAF25_007107 [Fusarium avenaceum]|uniref:F-box domain-containing protein n=1 Tax=Fusarium avenaceum TaxID=40199 RepID=A0A9P7KT83_9HYPO|nr:hypothetical protein KAF25_007107 [Fusarium avenaceum]
MDTNTTNPIVSLSTELILEIFDYLPPSSYFDLAISCSALHKRCQPVLDAHRAAHSKYRVTSDLHPETIIDLLKDNLSAKVERWHVRELEFWGTRHDWQDWRSFDPEPESPSGFVEGSVTRGRFEEEEINTYILKAHMLWDSGCDAFERARSDLQMGEDAFLKLLLIASCPRLHTLRYVDQGRDAHRSLQCIAKATKWSRLLAYWPPGFQSLRNIQVGVSGCPFTYGGVQNHPDGVEFAALLHIPNIESIYYNGLFTNPYNEDDEEVFDFYDKCDFPDKTSSVKHLFLDSVAEISPDFLNSISGTSKSLESMIIRADDTYSQYVDDMDGLVQDLARKYPHLEQLVMYNPGGFHGYRCVVYRPEELNNFESIKRITIAAADIELDAYYQQSSQRGKPTAKDLGEFVLEAFPSTVEAICIWGESDVHVASPDPAKPSGILDSAIAHLIESGAYKNLQVIYLEDVERAHRQKDRDIALGKPLDAGRKELAFQKSIAAGRKAGVHVCTLMNRDDGGYWRNFPARPDRFDLKTGPFGERPADLRFDVLTGEWGTDCEGCGECKECLMLYPPELWKSAARS